MIDDLLIREAAKFGHGDYATATGIDLDALLLACMDATKDAGVSPETAVLRLLRLSMADKKVLTLDEAVRAMLTAARADGFIAGVYAGRAE